MPAAASADDAFPTSPEEIIPEAKADDPTMLSYAATPRTALVNRAPGTDPASAVSSGVKTTAKGARPVRKDAKRDAKPRSSRRSRRPRAGRSTAPMCLPATRRAPRLPSFAHNLVRAAPSEVYTAGFQQGTQVADASRFTGKAVTFMTVARFSTN